MKRTIILWVACAIMITACKEEILPEASFVPSAYSCEVGTTIYFTNTSTNALTFEWDFGDGSNSAEENPDHTYTEEGLYTVRLYVTNDDGSDEDSLDIYVRSVSCWTKMTNMPTPRNTPAAMLLNNKIYLAGNSPELKFEAYNLETKNWEEKANMPTFNWEYPAGCVLNGKIYVLGGWANDATLNTLDEYDPTTDTWTSRSPMPTRRWGHTAFPFEGKIYVIGGAYEWPVVTFYKGIEIYDPTTDSWTTRDPQGDTEFTERWGYGVCMLNDKIYIIGGSDAVNGLSSIPALRTVQVYDPAENTWTTKEPMPTARSGLVAGAVNNKIYAIGGGKDFKPTEFSKVVEEYDPSTDTWVEIEGMPEGLIGSAACVYNNIIYIMGGGGFTFVPAYDCFYTYDPACRAR